MSNIPVIGYSREEQETVCLYDKENGKWSVYSNVQKHISKLIKQYGNDDCVDFKVVSVHESGSPSCVNIKGLPDVISFRTTAKREVTEEQRQQARERLMNARKK